MAIVEVLSRYVGAEAVPGERVETTAQTPMERYTPFLNPMKSLSSDGGLNLVGYLAKNFADILGIGRMRAYSFYPRANGTVEKWDRTPIRDPVCFIVTEDSNWDDHVALTCCSYSTEECAATGTTQFKAVFQVYAFQA